MTSHDWSHLALSIGIIALAVGVFFLAIAEIVR